MTYRILHETIYHYPEDVSLSHNLVHLTARTGTGQTRLRGELRLSVTPAVLTSRTDYFGNTVTDFTLHEPHRQLRVTAINDVRVHPEPAPDPTMTSPWDDVRDATRRGRDPATLNAYSFAFDSPCVRAEAGLAAFAAPSFPPGCPILEAVLDLSHRIHTGFAFDATATTVSTPLLEVLTLGRGVCQDFAHLMIGALRSLGLAARYVSGYLRTNPPPGHPRLVGADVSHAWVSVYCPPHGWIDVDPTNDVIPAGEHVTLAWGRDYDDVSPIKGVILGGGRHDLTVSVDVIPLDDGGGPGGHP